MGERSELGECAFEVLAEAPECLGDSRVLLLGFLARAIEADPHLEQAPLRTLAQMARQTLALGGRDGEEARSGAP